MRQVVLCYLLRGDEVLFLYRNKKPNDPNAGKYIGVGGKIEAGETPDDAVLREVKEETGYTLTHFTPRGVVYFQSDCWEDETMYVYTADGFTGTEIPCDEGDLYWIQKDKINSLSLWEGDKVFLPRLFDGSPYFTLTLRYKGDVLDGTQG